VKALEALDAVGSVSRVGRVRVLRVYESPCDMIVLAFADNKQHVRLWIKAILPCRRWLGGVSYGEETKGNRSHEFEGGHRQWSHDCRPDCVVLKARMKVFLYGLHLSLGNADGRWS
jgi:hypothetical protein